MKHLSSRDSCQELSILDEMKDEYLNPPVDPNEIFNGKRKRYTMTLNELAWIFINSMSPVSRDLWTRRVNKGKMTSDYCELLQEMFTCWKDENPNLVLTYERSKVASSLQDGAV